FPSLYLRRSQTKSDNFTFSDWCAAGIYPDKIIFIKLIFQNDEESCNHVLDQALGTKTYGQTNNTSTGKQRAYRKTEGFQYHHDNDEPYDHCGSILQYIDERLITLYIIIVLF